MPLDFLLDMWDAFLLIFVRITGLFVVAPVFGRQNLPAYYKIGFSFILAIVLSYTVQYPSPGSYASIFTYILLVAKEFITGLALGYISYFILTSIYLAGQMIDLHIGFGMVNVFDPEANIQIPVTANFYFILTMLIFIIIDGHHLLIYTLTESFSILPLGSRFTIKQPLMDFVIGLFGSVFAISFKIAAPVTAAVLIADLALGIIAKAVPQVNVFIVGLPLKILLGLGVILITLTVFRSIVHVLMGGMREEMNYFMEILREV
ncbi:MAG: flagellar type III secretion system protein FliR [Clostridiaceae bacterium]|nr:flagellar type III secretion system protein FliR [Clostridiaceae bacterium]